jgi:Zn-finger nucleic acid-binding protein
MATHPYYGPGNVVIDTCTACDLVWLDFGELAQIVDAPGRDRGRRGIEGAGSSGSAAKSTASTDGARAGDLFEVLLNLF